MTPIPLVSLEVNLGPLAPHNFSEIVVGMVLVGFIVLVMAKFVSPKFEAAYEKRTNEIEGGILRAEKAQAEADAARTQYQTQLAEAREDTAKLREEAKAQGALILAQMREQATNEAGRLLDQARVQIENERALVVSELRAEIGGMATTLASQIVGESLSDDERSRRIVDRFLADLEAQPVRTVPDYPENS